MKRSGCVESNWTLRCDLISDFEIGVMEVGFDACLRFCVLKWLQHLELKRCWDSGHVGGLDLMHPDCSTRSDHVRMILGV